MFLVMMAYDATEVRDGRIFYFPPNVHPPRLREVTTNSHVNEILAMGSNGSPVTIYTEYCTHRRHIQDLLRNDPPSEQRYSLLACDSSDDE